MTWFEWTIVAMFLVPILVGLVAFPRRYRKYAGLLHRYVEARGYTLLNPVVAQWDHASLRDMIASVPKGGLVSARDGITDLPDIARGTDDAASAVVCRLGGKEVTIFNFSASAGVDLARSVSYKVAKVACAGLARFSLARHSMVESVQKLVDMLAHNSDQSFIDPRFPEFFASYSVKGPDGGALSAFLTPDRVRYFQQQPLAGVIDTNARFLVYREDGVLRTEEDYDQFIATVKQLVTHLT
jgi:hypothetical protein